MPEPQREFHFIFGLREPTEPLHVLHYLCLASCLAVNRPHALHFHYRHEPFGPLWERVRPYLLLHRLPLKVPGYTPERYRDTAEGRLIEHLDLGYAHEADFMRLDLLLEHGGVYADMDTLFVRPYPDRWFQHECVIGEELSPIRPGQPLQPSLCNAVLFARPRARFIRAWRERMARVFDGRWNTHSCLEAARVWRDLPQTVNILPSTYFYPYGSSKAGLRGLLEETDRDHDDVFSVHLWAHLWWSAERTDFSTVHAGRIDEHWITAGSCTLARLARPFLDPAVLDRTDA